MTNFCQELCSTSPAAPLHPWEWPKQPWSRIHLDFAGPFIGYMFLIIIDSHSKRIDVQLMESMSASKTIEKLKIVFETDNIEPSCSSEPVVRHSVCQRRPQNYYETPIFY